MFAMTQSVEQAGLPSESSPRTIEVHKVKINEILRYPDVDRERLQKIRSAEWIDGLRNWYFETDAPDGMAWSAVQLPQGINTSQLIGDGDKRIPYLALRSSPHRFGTATTPWEDIHRPDQGYCRYFGDAKPGLKNAEEYLGNRRMLDAFVLQSGTREDRLKAPPVLVFEAVPYGGRKKGQVMFNGLGVIMRAELVVQKEEKTSLTFANYVYEIALFDLSNENEDLDWAWINARRDSTVSLDDCLKLAPSSWKKWVESGPAVLAGLRRNVLTRSVVSESMQRPRPGSKEDQILKGIYSYYTGKKHKFEALAEFIAQSIFQEQGIHYQAGWITQSGGDGGIDFVGAIDVDPAGAMKSSKQVVLGQAKCEKLGKSTSGLHIARLAARLRRGWIGVYVTTSHFSLRVQREVLADRYPVVLVDGARVASIVRKHLSDNGLPLKSFLDELSAQYLERIGFGDPESILA